MFVPLKFRNFVPLEATSTDSVRVCVIHLNKKFTVEGAYANATTKDLRNRDKSYRDVTEVVKCEVE